MVATELKDPKTNQRSEEPAIGLVGYQSDSEEVKQIVTRAESLNCKVIVVPPNGRIKIYDSRIRPEGNKRVMDQDWYSDDPKATLQAVAQEVDCSGVIIIEHIKNGIDYTRSFHKLQESNAFAVPAVEKGEGASGEFDKIVAGIPAYNEGRTIGKIVESTKEYVDEVIVVDDGSTDQTASAAVRNEATVIRHQTNRGKGAALQTLIRFIKEEEYSALVLLDGDGQHIPDDIPQVVHPVLSGTADLVIGSRYLRKGMGSETPFHRRFGQLVLDLFISVTIGISVTDSQSGFRALSPEAIERLDLETNGIGVEAEMLYTACQNGIEIDEQPIRVKYLNVDGQTYNSIYHGFSVLKHIIQLSSKRFLSQIRSRALPKTDQNKEH